MSRVLRHHVPLAVASGLAIVLLTGLFDSAAHTLGDIFSGPFPRQRSVEAAGVMDHGADHAGPMDHGTEQAGPMRHDAGHGGPMRHGGEAAGLTPTPDDVRHRSFTRQFTVASGYVALGLVGLTLVIGPANLLLARRNPVSSYLRRDVGAWAAILSIVHVIVGLQVHGSGSISGFLNYFVRPDGSVLLNSFGLANWTGLAALVIAVGLLAISTDAALRKLKAGPWKRIQRLNYALFALVVLHAFFYGALLRLTSPFTILLGISVAAVLVGQGMGVWLWRRGTRGAADPAS